MDTRPSKPGHLRYVAQQACLVKFVTSTPEGPQKFAIILAQEQLLAWTGMNGERYRGASLRFGLSTRHEGRRPARASNRGVRYNGNYMVVERMTAIADSVGQYVRSAIVGTDPHTRVSEACSGCSSTATRAGDS
jgi:hypothetical protein